MLQTLWTNLAIVVVCNRSMIKFWTCSWDTVPVLRKGDDWLYTQLYSRFLWQRHPSCELAVSF